jgi:hypothetical protein
LRQVRDFVRLHRPALLFLAGIFLALLPGLRRLHEGWPARLLAIGLFLVLTLPVSLLLLLAQMSRMAWLPISVPGEAWTGVAASHAHAANVVAFVLVICGLCALWGLSLVLIFGGNGPLRRRGPAWWILAGTMLVVVSIAFVAPHLATDPANGWYHFWRGWGRYYGRGAWLLLPFAQLLACAQGTRGQMSGPAPARWWSVAASASLVVFCACYALGAQADLDATSHAAGGAGIHAAGPAPSAD